MSSRYTCPVCGFAGLSDPPRSAIGNGSGEYCPCCVFQFGVTDDDQEFTYEQWRELWVRKGMPWEAPEIQAPPRNWNAQNQLDDLLRND